MNMAIGNDSNVGIFVGFERINWKMDTIGGNSQRARNLLMDQRFNLLPPLFRTIGRAVNGVDGCIAEIRKNIHEGQENIRSLLHDIRNIMDVMTANIEEAELCFTGRRYSEVDASLQSLGNKSGWLKRTLEITRSTFFGKSERIFSDDDLRNIINRALENSLVKKHNLEYSVKVSGQAPITIRKYENELSRVLINILNNASHAVLEGRSESDLENDVVILGNVREGVLQIEIADRGVGMDEKTCQEIFGLGFSTRLASGSGEGMGLHFCKQVIKNDFRGDISVRSTPGVGMVIRIDIPMEERQ